jgi:tetratricopeptide (TPR) repeat protein
LRGIDEVGPKARTAVARALQLDDELALAHAVSGTLKWRVDYDAAGAETELRRAMTLDPDSSLVLVPIAEFLMWRGDVERGSALFRRALEIQPLSPDLWVGAAFSLLTVRRYDSAITHFERALKLEPTYWTALFWLAETYGYEQRHDLAVTKYLEWLTGVLRPDVGARSRAELKRAYALGGWREFWVQELALAVAERAHPGSAWEAPFNRYTGDWYMARRYARLERWTEALDSLNRAYNGRHHLVATMALEPLFAPLRENSEFRALLRRTSAPEPHVGAGPIR